MFSVFRHMSAPVCKWPRRFAMRATASAPKPNATALAPSQGREALAARPGRLFDVPREWQEPSRQAGPCLFQRHIAVAGADARHQGLALRAGTELSGLEVPALALEALRSPRCRVFSSEACDMKRRYIVANFSAPSRSGACASSRSKPRQASQRLFRTC